MPPPAEIGPKVTKIEDAIARMEEINESNPENDGLRAFNHLYTDVTREVWRRLQNRDYFGDYEFMYQLDVEFANRYFDALRTWHLGSRDEVPKVWRKLLAKRDDREVCALQFACAGVNAHINFDLAVALVETWQKKVAEFGEGVQYADFNRINDIFDDLYKKFREDFKLSWGKIDDGPIEFVITMINEFAVEGARDSAWSRGEDLRAIRERGDGDAEARLLGRADRTYGGFFANVLLADYHLGDRAPAA